MFRMRMHHKMQGVVFNWLVSYILILLIPVVISAIVYFESINVLRKEINRVNSVMLSQLQSVIDDQLREAESLGIQIALNPNMQTFLSTKINMQQPYSYTIMQVLKEINLYTTGLSNIEGFYVIFNYMDLGLKSTGAAETETLFATDFKHEGLTYNAWRESLKKHYARQYMKVERRRNDGTFGSTIGYLQSLPISGNSQPSATSIVLLDETKLYKAVQNIKGINQGAVYIIDKNDNILNAMQVNEPLPPVRYGEMLQSSGMLIRGNHSSEVTVSYITSNITGWKYVTVIPSRVFSEKAEYVKYLTVASLILCLLLGSFAAYLIAKRNYNPVNQIIQILSSKAGLKPDRELNEYKFIKEAISQTLIETDNIKEKLKIQNNALRVNFLQRLIKGKLDSNISINEALSTYNIQFATEHFAVLLFSIEDYSRLFTYPDKESPEEKLKLVQFIISNVVEELACQKQMGYTVEMDELIACIINFSNEEILTGKEEMDRISREALGFIENKFNINISVSLGSIHETYFGIPESYNEALEALEYKMIMGTESIISYEAIRATKSSSSSYCYKLETEQKLINCIKAGDFSKAKDILDEVFEDNFTKGRLSVQMTRCLMFNLISTMIKTMDEISIVCDSFFIDQINPADQLLGCENIHDMKQRLTEILRKVCDYIETRKRSSSNLMEELKRFIKDNYKDPALSLNMLAERFDVGHTYLSKLIKQSTGEGILDYINTIRLEKARRLLQESDLSISDIGKTVGYYDSNAFIRVFKKYEGITPGQYREVNHKTPEA